MSLDGHHDHSAQTNPSGGEDMDRLATAVRERLSPFVFSRLKGCHAAEDILQETLLTMIERLGELRCPKCFWPWVFRIARRKIQDHFRRQKRWAAVQEGARYSTERRFDAIYGQLGGIDQMIAVESVQRLSDAILDLDVRQQQIVRLRCLEQVPYAEIACQTRTSPAQARINLHRAKLHLKKRLHALSA